MCEFGVALRLGHVVATSSCRTLLASFRVLGHDVERDVDFDFDFDVEGDDDQDKVWSDELRWAYFLPSLCIPAALVSQNIEECWQGFGAEYKGWAFSHMPVCHTQTGRLGLTVFARDGSGRMPLQPSVARYCLMVPEASLSWLPSAVPDPVRVTVASILARPAVLRADWHTLTAPPGEVLSEAGLCLLARLYTWCGAWTHIGSAVLDMMSSPTFPDAVPPSCVQFLGGKEPFSCSVVHRCQPYLTALLGDTGPLSISRLLMTQYIWAQGIVLLSPSSPPRTDDDEDADHGLLSCWFVP